MSREYHWRRIALALGSGVVVYLLAGALPLGDQGYPARMTAAITAVVATLWLSNAVHLAAASLVPLFAFPASGVVSVDDVAPAYAHPILWLFFGGFVLSLGVERWGLHRRLALGIIQRLGTRPSKLVLGFMMASACLSMWISNTATTLLLLPIALALIGSMEAVEDATSSAHHNFAFTLLVGIAYASSIGGITTPIGTAPNGLFFSAYSAFVAKGAPPISFVTWLMVALPLAFIMVPLVWWLLVRVLAPLGPARPNAQRVIEAEAAKLPPMDAAERRILALFGLAAALWITRADLALGELGTVPGWWRLLPVPKASYVGDAAVAVLVAFLSFVVPSGRERGQALMNWDTARQIPWDVLILIGGGIAIANAFTSSGLAAAIGHAAEPWLNTMPPLLMVVLVCTIMTFMTEITSNTAMAALFLPILMSSAVAAQVDPRLLMIPATWSASCAFMLPVATPPNAIVFASGRISMGRMARAGIVLNLLGIAVITLLAWWLVRPMLGIEASGLPGWAR